MPNLTKASMLVFSHLSNAQESLRFSSYVSVDESIKFAKYVILMCNYNLNQEVDADAMYKRFTERGKKPVNNEAQV